MRINEIVLIPGAGHLADGVYSRGHTVDALSEVDLVDKYVAYIADELDHAAIRHRVLKETRKAPGLSPEGRAYGIMPGTLVVSCRVGWTGSKKVKAVNNLSAVFFGSKESEGFARELAQVIGHWGALYVFGHRSASPAYDETRELALQIPGCWGLRIEPFQLNAPNVLEYARRLPQLGRDVGRAIAEWVEERGDYARIRPNSLATKACWQR